MTNNKPNVSLQAYMRSGAVQQRLEEMLDKRAGQFTASLMSVINSNSVLQECDPKTVLSAAITAASMDLPITPGLGFAFIIPYKNKGKYEAQFQMGYKGFIQLAMRSGQFKRINASDVREGEFISEDQLTGELKFKWIADKAERATKEVVGYVGFFRLVNGFEKELYMSVDELKAHAKKYSQSYKKGYGLWVDEFGVMSKKTVLKLLISGYGALSTDMQRAVLADQAAVEEDSYNYVDNQKARPDNEDEDDTPKQAPPATDKQKAEAAAARKAEKSGGETYEPKQKTAGDDEGPAIKPNNVTISKKRQTGITKLVDTLGLSGDGKMRYTRKAAGVPTTHMFKENQQWEDLEAYTNKALNGEAEVDPAWLAEEGKAADA